MKKWLLVALTLAMLSGCSWNKVWKWIDEMEWERDDQTGPNSGHLHKVNLRRARVFLSLGHHGERKKPASCSTAKPLIC